MRTAWLLSLTVSTLLVQSSFSSSLAEQRPTTGEPADQFKQFIHDPPPIANLVYSQEVPRDPKTTNSMDFFLDELRWQTNAVFFAQSYSNLAISGEAADLEKYSSILANYEKKFSRRMGVNLYLWTDAGRKEEERNSLTALRDLTLQSHAADMLNMGCHLIPVGSVQWAGDGFLVTNANQGIWVNGKLSRDSQGRATMMTVEAHDLKTPNEISQVWTYRYYYDGSLSLPFLPSRIVSLMAQDGETNLISIFKIYSLEAAAAPLPESQFSIPDHIATNNLVAQIVVSNKYLYYSQQGQHFRLADSFAADQARQITKGVYYFIALMFLSPLILYWLQQRKQNKNK